MPKKTNQLTAEDLLRRKPRRGGFEYYIDENGFVRIKVPKFRNNLGKSICRLLHKEESFTANLDRIGSTVWNLCDGNTTVKQILDVLKKEFPDEENLDQRLFLFLQQMYYLNYILL
ncbi:MAG TPA: PqqD family protein [Thermoplasmatales archaeon]|nr:PqqD family protein [Thermoplasmatales archaeon]